MCIARLGRCAGIFQIAGTMKYPIFLLLSLAFLTGTQCDPSMGGRSVVTPVTQAPTQTPTMSGDVNSGTVSPPPVGSTPSPAATLLEQLTLERINRARLRPGDEARRFGIALDEGVPGQINATPKQPLAMNSTLRKTAMQHTDDMLSRNYFAHDTPEGESPFDRMMRNGYAFVAAGENLAWRGTTGTLDPVSTVEKQHEDLFVDKGIADRGHRTTMLNGDFREVGISIRRGSFTRLEDGTVFSDSIMNTQDYGTAPSAPTFVLGIVYDDADGNGAFDHGEGIANTGVSLGDVVKSTNQAGGYVFRVNQSGTYTLKFSIGPSQSVTIDEGDANIKIDLVDRSRLVVNLGLGKLD